MDDAEKELYDFAYDWFRGDNVIGGADDERAVKFANAAQEFATTGDFRNALRLLLNGVWCAGYADRENEEAGE